MEPEIQEESTIDYLKTQIASIQPTDTMAEATRKALLIDFISLLENEAGSRTGEDIENVHDMRVATRRMRSAFKLLGEYYKSKPVRGYMQGLKQTASYLGAVRDLDVMIANLQAYQSKVDEDDSAALTKIIAKLDKKRAKARKKLVDYLDSEEYTNFVEAYTAFLLESGKGAKSVDEDSAEPFQVRHVVPIIVHEHLATVRAYDNVLEEADINTLHALRIEFKELRYLVDYFSDVLGNTAGDFISELKKIQDHLGRIQDIDVAQASLHELMDDLKRSQRLVLEKYLAEISAEQPELIQQFPEVWGRFNTRTVQQKLANALLMLR